MVQCMIKGMGQQGGPVGSQGNEATGMPEQGNSAAGVRGQGNKQQARMRAVRQACLANRHA